VRYLNLVVLCSIGFVFGPKLLAQESQNDSSQQMDDVKILASNELSRYAKVRLTANLDHLSENQKKMVSHLIQAGEQMNSAFWKQAFGDPAELMKKIPNEKRQLAGFAEVNYGPWDRLQDDRPFIESFGSKPLGANLYPRDMTKKEFEKAVESNESLKSLYTIVRRSDTGSLTTIDYSKFFKVEFSKAAEHLLKAAELAEDPGFKAYLTARAKALLSDEYRESDMLWMDMKNNRVDVVIGPIETYEDKLFGYKAACECYVLIKDMKWSERLSKYASLLPKLQKTLPVEEKYKKEKPGLDSDLNAYDVVFYAGDCNAGSKTIAINLPNDEEVQLKKGTRRLQLKNAMQAKYDKIMEPIADLLIVADQRKHITFNAFFSNTMFHEVAHGLGIKYTIDNGRRVREALLDTSSALEEGKADILGLYMITELMKSGELSDGELEDYYVTFMAGIFRSVRFGASSAHGKANMIRFNFFESEGAFTRESSGRYRINMDKMKVAMKNLTAKLLQLQGDGDYKAAREFVDKMAFVGDQLKADLNRVNAAGIPTDIVFEQGIETLKLDGSISLFNGKNLDGWSKTNFGGEGEIDVKDGNVVIEAGVELSGINLTDSVVPTENYEISLSAMRLDGQDMFCGITFPVGDEFCSLIVGGWGGSLVGLSCVDGNDAARNSTKKILKFENERWYGVRIRVTDEVIECFIDGKKIISQETAGKQFSIRDDCSASEPFGVFSFQTRAALRDVRLKHLATK